MKGKMGEKKLAEVPVMFKKYIVQLYLQNVES